MIITPLWHTEFLVDITNKNQENVRILVDIWLSDFAIGDLMERTMKVRLDPEKIRTLDAIYISHAHCDHFDPYTLIEIYAHGSPILILPFALRYLEVLIHEYLPQTEIHWLRNWEIFHFQGIEIVGYMWPNPDITNEDDVMMVAFSNERELLFAEVDTVPDEYSEEVQKSLYKVFTRKKYETACYLASRNGLEWQIPYYDVTESKRKSFRDRYIADQKENMQASYEKYDYEEYAHFPNLFTLPGFVRGFIGQGIRYPRAISESLSNLVLFPLDEIVSIEHDYAKNAGYEFSQKALLPGRQYIVEGAMIETWRKDCPIGELIKNETEEGGLGIDRLFASWPLIPREISEREIENVKNQILEVLNSRFLPYWSASPVASLRDALLRNNGAYTIACKIKNENQKLIFTYSTSYFSFVEAPYEEGMWIDEDYWLSDIIDFLEGRQEMYSSFWHRLDPKKSYRLWTCLGATFMNHDLNVWKYWLHFERARRGESPNEFVEEILKAL
jgi:Beta-lactamase superfamily domain